MNHHDFFYAFPTKPFDNKIIVEPVPGKPHIVKIGGKWRVSSSRHKANPSLYVHAHNYIWALNNKGE